MSDQSDEVLIARLGERFERVSALSARYPIRVDIAITLTTATVSVIGLVLQNRPHLVLLAFCAGLCLPMLLHRRAPEVCFGLIAATGLLQWLTAGDELADAAVLISLYWVARSGSLRAVLLASTIAEAGALAAAIRWAPAQPFRVWVGLTGLVVAATVLGITVRQQRALLASLRARAATLEFERDQEGRIAAAAERARIAREMHDIVAHNLTVMTALADAATYTLAAEEGERVPALERISATGRNALGEMRRLLGVLGDEPSTPSLEPQPTLARLDELISRIEAAGIPVTLELEGDPHLLPDGIQLAIFRVAQEALTNTLKHATRPSAARLRLCCHRSHVELEVTDQPVGERDDQRAPRGETARQASEPSGHLVLQPADHRRNAVATLHPAPAGRGIRGMHERAIAYGGDLNAGPDPAGGWRVQLRLEAGTTDAHR